MSHQKYIFWFITDCYCEKQNGTGAGNNGIKCGTEVVAYCHINKACTGTTTMSNGVTYPNRATLCTDI